MQHFRGGPETLPQGIKTLRQNEFPHHSIILSIAKNLFTSTLCIQIFRYAQNDTTL